MKYFLVTFHETDSNDTTVFDTIVDLDVSRDADVDHEGCESLTCETCKDAAFGVVCNAIAKRLDDDGRPYSDDGGFGFYFDCTDRCVEDCEGHGGIVMRDAEGFETRATAEAEQAKMFYHSRF